MMTSRENDLLKPFNMTSSSLEPSLVINVMLQEHVTFVAWQIRTKLSHSCFNSNQYKSASPMRVSKTAFAINSARGVQSHLKFSKI